MLIILLATTACKCWETYQSSHSSLYWGVQPSQVTHDLSEHLSYDHHKAFPFCNLGPGFSWWSKMWTDSQKNIKRLFFKTHAFSSTHKSISSFCDYYWDLKALEWMIWTFLTLLGYKKFVQGYIFSYWE